MELSPGNYQLSIDAIEKDRRYKVFYDTEEFTLKESELKMENLQVIEECIGTITEEKAIQESEKCVANRTTEKQITSQKKF